MILPIAMTPVPRCVPPAVMTAVSLPPVMPTHGATMLPNVATTIDKMTIEAAE